MSAVHYSNEELNRFWLSILADNALIIYNALSPAETDLADHAKAYSERLDALAMRAAKGRNGDDASLNDDTFRAAQDLRKFFIYVLDRKTSEDFHLDLKTMAVSSFANQAEKYLQGLDAFMKGTKPEYNPITEEVFWLLIFSNQCRYIADNLGNFQKRYKEKAQELAEILNQYWSFSIELQGVISKVGDRYTRLADEHHVAVNKVLRELYEYISAIIMLQKDTRIPGSISLLYLDRARRMVCFYLMQWAQSINETKLDCDPYAKRISIY